MAVHAEKLELHCCCWKSISNSPKSLNFFSFYIQFTYNIQNQMRFFISMYDQKVGPSFTIELSWRSFTSSKIFFSRRECRFCLQHGIIKRSKVKFDVLIDEINEFKSF
ncbi:uncharacterized protein DS421_8g247070 [Arachis hypogaea]|nr:uncharacterized protein DS421_8g247070 [Arachis hypogaea]